MELICVDHIVIQITVEKLPTEHFSNQEMMEIQSLMIKLTAKLEQIGTVTGMIGVHEHDTATATEDRSHINQTN